MCEFCPTDGSRCGVCDAVSNQEQWKSDEDRTHTASVAGCCIAGFILFVIVAGICAAVNLSGGAK